MADDEDNSGWEFFDDFLVDFESEKIASNPDSSHSGSSFDLCDGVSSSASETWSGIDWCKEFDDIAERNSRSESLKSFKSDFSSKLSGYDSDATDTSRSEIDWCKEFDDNAERNSIPESLKSFKSDFPSKLSGYDSDAAETSSNVSTTSTVGFYNSLWDFEESATVYEPPAISGNGKKFLDNLWNLLAATNDEMPLANTIREHTLPCLSATHLHHLKSVNKTWNKWISSPFCAHKQSYLYKTVTGYFTESFGATTVIDMGGFSNPHDLTFLSEIVKVKSSCRGLLLCQGGENNYYVCNPFNKGFKKLPRPTLYQGDHSAITLVFEPDVLNMGAHYHVICVVPDVAQPIVRFEIYSSETNSWRCSDDSCGDFQSARIRSAGYFYKGIVYWETECNNVLAFDLKNEVHGVISLPINAGVGGSLTHVNGELCYLRAYKFYGNVYNVNVYGGANMELRKSVPFDIGGYLYGSDQICHVLPAVDEGESAMVLLGETIYCCKLRETNRLATVMSRGCKKHALNAKFFPYISSMVEVA